MDVTGALASDHVAMRAYTQLRLVFDSPTDNDGAYDAALFDPDTTQLVVSYLVP